MLIYEKIHRYLCNLASRASEARPLGNNISKMLIKLDAHGPVGACCMAHDGPIGPLFKYFEQEFCIFSNTTIKKCCKLHEYLILRVLSINVSPLGP